MVVNITNIILIEVTHLSNFIVFFFPKCLVLDPILYFFPQKKHMKLQIPFSYKHAQMNNTHNFKFDKLVLVNMYLDHTMHEFAFGSKIHTKISKRI